jgi:catecholate siderophore receptor
MTNPSAFHPESDSRRFASRAATVTALIVAHGLATSSAQAGDAAADVAKARTDDPVKLDRLTVADSQLNAPLSSPKFTEPVRDIPQTVTVIPAAVFEQQGAQNLSDVLRNTPGVTFTAGEGGSMNSGDAFYMRGFEVGGNGGNGIFIDGVRDNGAVSRDVYNLEQVEIAKGPAGADNGRGATSGYVNLASKSPRLEAFAATTLSYGFDERSSIDRWRSTVDLNQPLATSSVKGVAFRLNALWQEGGVAGRDYVEQNRWSVAPSLAFGLGTPTRIVLSYERTEQDNVPDGGVPAATNPEITTSTPLTSPRGQTNFYGLPAYDHEDVTMDRSTLRLEHDFAPDLRLLNQTRVAKTHRFAEVSLPSYSTTTGLASRNRNLSDRTTEITSNQTNLSAKVSTGSIVHSVSSGLELTREKAESPAWTGAGTVAGTDLLHPDLNAPFLTARAPARTGAYTDARTDTGALYLFDTAKFNEHWQATAGLRWEHYKTKYLSVPATGTTTAPTQLETSDDLLTYKAGLVFKPVAAGTIYAAYGNSIRPPGTNFTISTAATNADNPGLEPQEAHNYELGSKWEFFKSRLLVTAALFRSENDNVALTDPVTGLVVQTTQQTVQGVELGASGQLTPAWYVFGGFSWLDSEYSSPSAPAATSNGAELQWTPKYSGNVWTTYRLPFGVVIGGGGRYQAATQRSLTVLAPSTAGGQTPKYWVFDAMASYEVNKKLSLRLNVTNFTDKLYAKSLNNNGGRYNPGTPRSYVLTANYRF